MISAGCACGLQIPAAIFVPGNCCFSRLHAFRAGTTAAGGSADTQIRRTFSRRIHCAISLGRLATENTRTDNPFFASTCLSISPASSSASSFAGTHAICGRLTSLPSRERRRPVGPSGSFSLSVSADSMNRRGEAAPEASRSARSCTRSRVLCKMNCCRISASVPLCRSCSASTSAGRRTLS